MSHVGSCVVCYFYRNTTFVSTSTWRREQTSLRSAEIKVKDSKIRQIGQKSNESEVGQEREQAKNLENYVDDQNQRKPVSIDETGNQSSSSSSSGRRRGRRRSSSSPSGRRRGRRSSTSSGRRRGRRSPSTSSGRRRGRRSSSSSGRRRGRP